MTTTSTCSAEKNKTFVSEQQADSVVTLRFKDSGLPDPKSRERRSRHWRRQCQCGEDIGRAHLSPGRAHQAKGLVLKVRIPTADCDKKSGTPSDPRLATDCPREGSRRGIPTYHYPGLTSAGVMAELIQSLISMAQGRMQQSRFALCLVDQSMVA